MLRVVADAVEHVGVFWALRRCAAPLYRGLRPPYHPPALECRFAQLNSKLRRQTMSEGRRRLSRASAPPAKAGGWKDAKPPSEAAGEMLGSKRKSDRALCSRHLGDLRRRPLIDPEIEPRIFRAIAEKSDELNCALHAIGGTADHVHVLLRMHPSLSVAGVVGAAKGASSHLVQREIGEPFRWQTGYSAFTVAAQDVSVVESYIRRQKEHHLHNAIEPRLELG